jgi:hypothetical protein
MHSQRKAGPSSAAHQQGTVIVRLPGTEIAGQTHRHGKNRVIFAAVQQQNQG